MPALALGSKEVPGRDMGMTVLFKQVGEQLHQLLGQANQPAAPSRATPAVEAPAVEAYLSPRLEKSLLPEGVSMVLPEGVAMGGLVDQFY